MGAEVADWQNHHIEGYARAAMEAGKDGYFNAPLISHIEDNLYVGGCNDGVRLDDDFQTVVSLYKWERYALGPDTERIEVTMYDSGDVAPSRQLHEIADVVVAALERGGKVLIHCQAGLNRSNLITALALMKRGRTADEAIDLLREKRSPVVLCNASFEAWLRPHVPRPHHSPAARPRRPPDLSSEQERPASEARSGARRPPTRKVPRMNEDLAGERL